MAKFGLLIGNGFSIAYNPELAIESLTQGLVTSFRELTGGSVETALAGFATTVDQSAPTGFEQLLGPLDAVASSLSSLGGMLDVSSTAQASIADAIRTTSSFLRTLYRVGFGTTLGLIAERAKAERNASFSQTVLSTCEAISALPAYGPICVGTLNYDGLLHAGFLDLAPQGIGLADLAQGNEAEWKSPDGEATFRCMPLREYDDLPPRSIELLNLHGSLGWLQDFEGERAWKFNLDDLRDVDYWKQFREGRAELRPAIVLTNRKSELIVEPPFSLAYSIFQQRMTLMDRWAFVGYSFGDAPVNTALRNAAQERRRQGLSGPKVLVVTRANSEMDVLPLVISRLRIPSVDVSVDTDGIPAALIGSAWAEWAVN